jgi:hypothetical protein
LIGSIFRKHADLKQIGHELGVRYVLEGSVQRGGNRMPVNAQLNAMALSRHQWINLMPLDTCRLALSHPGVLMMKSAEVGNGHDPS